MRRTLTIALLLASVSVFALDFAMRTVSLPYGTVSGANMVMNVSYYLEGTGNSQIPVPVEIFLSKDSVYDAGDVSVAKASIYSYPNYQVNWVFNFSLPANAASGDYFLVRLDVANTNVESNELNNKAKIQIGAIAAPIRDLKAIPADLYGTAFVQNSTYNIKWGVANNGNCVLNSTFTYKMFFSKDAVLDASDEELSTKTVTGELLPGRESTTSAITQKLKSTWLPGKYYMLTQVIFPDDNQSNTISATPFTILKKDVDLAIDRIETASTVFSKGDSAQFTAYFVNKGTTDQALNDKVNYRWYLSADNKLDAQDFYEGSGSYYPFYGFTFTARFPSNWSGTNAYVILASDFVPADGIDETDTTNNNGAFAVAFASPKADIAVGESDNSRFFRTSTYIDVVGRDDKKTFTVTIYNKGNVSLQNVPVSLYLSFDTVFNSADAKLVDMTLATLGRNSSSSLVPYLDSITIPLGTYYVFVVADPTNTISEYDKTNNKGYFEYVRSAPAYDYSYENVYVDNISLVNDSRLPVLKRKLGDTLSVDYYLMTVFDITLQTYPKVELGVYFSEDKNFDANKDILLGMVGSTGNRDQEVVLKGALPSKGHILVMIDPLDKLDEYTRLNNFFSIPIELPLATSLLEYASTPSQLQLFPNPTQDKVFWGNRAESFRLSTAYGQRVMEGANTDQLSLEHLPAGAYLLELTVDGKTETHQVIKK